MATLNELITKVSEQRDVLVLNLNEAGVTSINSETLNVLVPKVLLVKKDLTPLIVVTVETDAVVTAKNESAGKTLQETSVDGSVQFNIDDFGTWTISATKDGQTSNEVEVLVERDERDISLSFFSATVTINAETGSQVTLKNNNTFNQTISAGNGKAIFTVPAAGSYTASATFDGIPSNTQQVEVIESGGNYSTTLNYIKLTVNCPEGSLIVVSKDNYSYSQTSSSGSYTFRLPETGTWNVEISLDTQSASETVNCDSYTNFSISLSYFAVYGVRIALNNSNPETSVEYIDGATGMTPGWDNWKDKKIFKDIKPCVLKNGIVQYYLQRDNYTLKEQGGSSTLTGNDGDVMVEFPKIGYKMTNDSNYQYIWVTDNPNAEGFCYLAHSLDSEGDCDKIYIGAYLAYTEGLITHSISNHSPSTNLSLEIFRGRTETRGTGYQLLSFYPLTLLQCLYVIIYKNLNSQLMLGQGYVNASAVSNTGSTNTDPFCYGSFSSGTTHVKFLGIEDFYGNLLQWIDGLYCDSSYNVKTDYNNFTGTDGSAFRYSQSGFSSIMSGYINKISGTNNGGFVPLSANGSSSTYYADDAYLDSDCFGVFGGYWSTGANAGAFRLDVDYAASDSYSNLGCRVVYKHKQS